MLGLACFLVEREGMLEVLAGYLVLGCQGSISEVVEVVAILMVEQNAAQALDIADKGYVLVNGTNKHTGNGEELLANPVVRRTFLGG